jgi:hypothetical protein
MAFTRTSHNQVTQHYSPFIGQKPAPRININLSTSYSETINMTLEINEPPKKAWQTPEVKQLDADRTATGDGGETESASGHMVKDSAIRS